MNILSIGMKCDLLALMYELAEGGDVVINQLDNGKSALVHLGETTITYDWIIIDHRESERYSERWDEALANLSKCKVIVIPRGEMVKQDCAIGVDVSDKQDAVVQSTFTSLSGYATVYELGAPTKRQA